MNNAIELMLKVTIANIREAAFKGKSRRLKKSVGTHASAGSNSANSNFRRGTPIIGIVWKKRVFASPEYQNQ